jgi:hypothetical protein
VFSKESEVVRNTVIDSRIQPKPDVGSATPSRLPKPLLEAGVANIDVVILNVEVLMLTLAVNMGDLVMALSCIGADAAGATGTFAPVPCHFTGARE